MDVPVGVIQAPRQLQAADPEGVIYTVFLAALFVGVVGWLIFEAVRRRSALPILLLVGGAVTSLQEPMLDVLGLVWWPENLPGPAFTIFDRPMPYLVPIGYTFYVAGGAYVVYRLIAGGTSARKLFKVALALEAADIFFEMPWLSLGVYEYYGSQPFEVFEFPLWWAPVNGTAPFLAGLVLYVLLPRLEGWRIALAAAVPPLCWAGVYGASAWPTFAALNADVPEVVEWVAATVTMVIATAITWLIAQASASPLVRRLGAGTPAPDGGVAHDGRRGADELASPAPQAL